MAKADIIKDLEVLGVGYDDKMTVAQLEALLDKATSSTAEPEVKQETPTRVEVPEAPGVTLGVGTINDHEQRIFALEQKMK